MTRKAGREYKRPQEKSLTAQMVAQEIDPKSEIDEDNDIIQRCNDCDIRDSLFSGKEFYDENCIDDYYDYIYGINCPTEPPTLLIENSWKPEDSYNHNDKGVGYLRYMMESVKPSEVHTKDFRWIVSKYIIISAIIAGKLLSLQFIESENKLLFGRYCVELEKMLRKFGVEFKLFEGLTKKGWETYQTLQAEDCTA